MSFDKLNGIFEIRIAKNTLEYQGYLMINKLNHCISFAGLESNQLIVEWRSYQ